MNDKHASDLKVIQSEFDTELKIKEQLQAIDQKKIRELTESNTLYKEKLADAEDKIQNLISKAVEKMSINTSNKQPISANSSSSFPRIVRPITHSIKR